MKTWYEFVDELAVGDILALTLSLSHSVILCADLMVNQEEKDLFETISQCQLSATDRDCLAGWGSVVYLITQNSVTVTELKARQD